MRYTYECKKCNNNCIVNKPMSESSKKEHCDKCGSLLERVYNISAIKTGDGLK